MIRELSPSWMLNVKATRKLLEMLVIKLVISSKLS